MQVLFTDPNKHSLDGITVVEVSSLSQQHLSSIKLTLKLQKQYSSLYMLKVELSFVYLVSSKVSKAISPLTNVIRNTKNKINLIIIIIKNY
mgnify:CR=1 FL=1